MKPRLALVLGLGLILLAGLGALQRVAAEPGLSDGGGAADCATCHEGTVQQTHTPEFVLESHGPAGLADRNACLGCHESQSCDDCHSEQAPAWHTESFRTPGSNRSARLDHTRIAMSRSGDCMECHAARFQIQCAKCHIPGEWPR